MKLIPSRGDERRAFTLIEIMIVVLLIGVLTAVIVPEMKGSYKGELLRSTSRELISVFQVASSRSISFNRQHRVRIDRKTGKYFIEKLVRQRDGETFVPLRDIPGGEGELDTRITVEVHPSGENLSTSSAEIEPVSAASEAPESPGTDQTIAFYPDGTADRADVVLQDRDHFRMALRINPVTARVRVVELPPE